MTKPTVVGFRYPLLSLVVAGAKRLDMRLASDPATCRLLPGAVVVAAQGGPNPFRHPLRVTAVRSFPSPSDAYAHYQRVGQQSALFPPAWCRHDGRAVLTPADAQSYYLQLFNRPAAKWALPGATVVRVFVVEPMPLHLLGEPLCGSAPTCNLHTRLPSLPLCTIAEFDDAPTTLPLPQQPDAKVVPCTPVTQTTTMTEPRCLPYYKPVAAPERAPASGPVKGLPAYLPLTVAAVDASTAALATLDPGLVEKVVSDARRRARARGSAVVTARDFASSAAVIAGHADPSRDPAGDLPQHFDEVIEQLALLRERAASLSRGELGPGSGRRVRILVAGETSATVARMFIRAGAEVATCDLKPTADPDIPHFQGDVSSIADLGWDLVIAHPPCTYLANAGVTWLHRDPERWDHMVANADTFRRMYYTRAPFVAIENSKMHRYGRALVGVSPTQYTHPHQHGTGHTKPVALYLRNLPPIRPTCSVTGREHAIARLPPTPDRSAIRSRTYVGIAGAMALQWMPVLMEYVAALPVHQGPSVAEMVAQASSPAVTTCTVAFTRGLSVGHSASEVVTMSGHLTLPTTTVNGTSSPIEAIRAWTEEQTLLPHLWLTALTEATRVFPTGHRTLTFHRSGQLRISHVWCLDVSQLGCQHLPLPRQPVIMSASGTADGRSLQTSADLAFQWSSIANASPWNGAPLEERSAYMELLRCPVVTPTDTAPESYRPPRDPPPIAAVVEASVKDLVPLHAMEATLPATRRPWLVESPKPQPPPPPLPRVIKRRHGVWRAWVDTAGPQTATPSFGWQPLPSVLNGQLDAYLRPADGLLPMIPEAQAVDGEAAAVAMAAVVTRPV